MAGEIDARHLAQRLTGRTIPTIAQARPNVVMGIEGAQLRVGTEDSPEGSLVPLNLLQRGLDILHADGEIRIEPETFGNVRRSSFVGAALAQLHGVEATAQPSWVRLGDSRLRLLFERACAEVVQQRATPEVHADDPFYRLFAREIPDQLSEIAGTTDAYKSQGSAGQLNFLWAETPWAGVFDPLVTESAQDGYYLVYLVPRNGGGVHLSLMQGTTAVRGAYPRRAGEVLEERARTYASYLEPEGLDGLDMGPIDLQGEGTRTRSYEIASVVSRFYSASAMPDDSALAEDLLRFLRLYSRLVEVLDQAEIEASPDAPPEAKEGTEAKRYRWHLRAEGRNRTVVRRAKELQGYVCRVCGIDFAGEYGELGKRSIDAHHKQPFTELDERPRAVDPIEDFDIVCANHHRMLHIETPPMTVEVLRTRLGYQ